MRCRHHQISGDRIEEILVQEDTWVKEGTPLARLNSYGTLKASYDEASENVAVAQSKLAQVQAGAKQGEIRAQEFNVQSLERKLAAQKLAQDQAVNAARAKATEARVEQQRYDALYASGGVSALERDRYRTRAETSVPDGEALEIAKGSHIYLIDGSGYIFRAFHAMPPMTNPAGVPVNAVFGFTQMISRFLLDHRGSHIAVVFDASRLTFRNDIYPDYKAHRPDPPPELVPQFALIRDATDALGLLKALPQPSDRKGADLLH
jgi:hypothetical protein